jgi:hypothetical protein
MAGIARAEGLKFGVIYNGDGDDATNAAWVADARRHIDAFETGQGVIPDHAIFQTWDQHPTRALPMDSDDSVGGMVGYYLRQRVRLQIDRSATRLHGQLTEASSGRPVAGARITLQVLGSDPSRTPPIRTVTGTVGPRARYAILGLRVNTECLCGGDNHLLIGPLTYGDSEGVRQTVPVPMPAGGQAIGSNTPLVRAHSIGGEEIARVTVRPDQHFAFNSAVFPVMPGAHFAFAVPMGAVGEGGLFGTVTVIWLDADHHGLYRTVIRLPDDATEVATVTTGADGRFDFPARDVESLAGRRLKLEFQGNPADRGAVAYAG